MRTRVKVIETEISAIKLLEPKIFQDDRGFFLESYNQKILQDILGIADPFVQDNHSHSQKGVLRGLHYQMEKPQGKLVRVVSGEIYDVAVDLRRSSATFGKWVGFYLSSNNKCMAWIPPGFAHGFLVTSNTADVLYKVTSFYHPPSDRSMLWNDEDIGIDWPTKQAPLLSPKDEAGKFFKDAEVYI